MSNSAWCDLKSKGDIIKLHDKCPNPKCNWQKIITFTRHQYMLKSGSKKVSYKNFLKEHKLLSIIFFGPSL